MLTGKSNKHFVAIRKTLMADLNRTAQRDGQPITTVVDRILRTHYEAAAHPEGCPDHGHRQCLRCGHNVDWDFMVHTTRQTFTKLRVDTALVLEKASRYYTRSSK